MHILRPLALAAGPMLVSIAAFAQGTISNLPRPRNRSRDGRRLAFHRSAIKLAGFHEEPPLQ
jgi:hypothetical protein